MLRKNNKQHPKGMALVVVLIFVAVFTALSVSMFTMSSGNIVTAENVHHSNSARAVAESGLQVLRYIAEGVQVTGSDADTKLYDLYTNIQDRLEAVGMSNTTVEWDNETILLSNITLNSTSSESVTIRIDTLGEDSLIASVTGTHDNLSRTIRVRFDYKDQAQAIFDFGIATKGPLLMSGQSSVAGVNSPDESDVFIDTDLILDDSLSIGNQASIAGEVHIVDSNPSYSIGKKSSIGGETGTAAEDHVYVAADPVDFPIPDTDYFKQYATGDIIDSSSNLSNYSVLNNVTIAANTNPTFASHMQINGVLYIEQPNDVKFSGQVDIAGIIVGDSDAGESVGSLDFSGQVECSDVSSLEGSEFEAIKGETGTFIMAPGFSADFAGQANTINGLIAIGGIRFTGQSGGQINGSIINYSEDPMVMQGQGELLFNRPDNSAIPAGFQAVQILEFNPTDYEEVP